MRFQTKLVLLIGAVLLTVILLLVYSFQYMAADTLKHQMGERVLNVAETVSLIPEIQQAFSDPNPAKTIQPIAESIRIKTKAEFVVVANAQGIRYSHPDPDRIGKEFVGGDNIEAMQGRSIISEAKGTLGTSLRGIAPIYGKTGQVIGIVAVGFSIQSIDDAINSYRDRIILLGLIALVLGILCTLLIARNVLKSLFGLEPKEIGRLYQEKIAILESIREGILAIDAKGTVTMANRTAMQMLGFAEEESLEGRQVESVSPNTHLLDVLRTGRAEFDQEMFLSQEMFVVNQLPVFDAHGKVIGAVSSLRNKSELYRLAEELSNVRVYAEALRAQTHEFNNKLYTVSGLIQLKSYQKAIEYISDVSDFHQNLIQFIMQEIPDAIIGGLLIGKINRANELKVDLQIDPESSFRDLPPELDRNHLIRILGNLIDNAIEAVLPPQIQTKRVKVFLTDLGSDLILEVEDHGVGLSEQAMERMFELGFSTKTDKNHGFGMTLVQQSVQHLHGYLTYTSQPHSGTVFTVAIPKHTTKKDNREEGDLP